MGKYRHKKNLIFLTRKSYLIKILNKYFSRKNQSINVSNFFNLKLIYILFKIKIFNHKIIFFHECCNPLFDSLINILNIKGLYFPIADPLKMEKGYNISAFKVNFLPLKKKIIYFFFHFLIRKFKFYMRKNPDGIPVLYFVMRKYNKNILIQKKNLVKKNHFFKTKTKKGKLLIFLSKVPNINGQDYNYKMIKTFVKLINFCKKENIKVYIKDHPTKSSRINLKEKNLSKIDPEKPAELIKYDDYDFFVSLTSNSLCSFDGKAVSVVNLISKKKNVVKFYKQPFVNRDLKGIKYPKTFNELFMLIKNS